jgi:hypothetical protein
MRMHVRPRLIAERAHRMTSAAPGQGTAEAPIHPGRTPAADEPSWCEASVTYPRGLLAGDFSCETLFYRPPSSRSLAPLRHPSREASRASVDV